MTTSHSGYNYTLIILETFIETYLPLQKDGCVICIAPFYSLMDYFDDTLKGWKNSRTFLISICKGIPDQNAIF